MPDVSAALAPAPVSTAPSPAPAPVSTAHAAADSTNADFATADAHGVLPMDDGSEPGGDLFGAAGQGGALEGPSGTPGKMQQVRARRSRCVQARGQPATAVAVVLVCLVRYAAASSLPDPNVNDPIVKNATALRAAIEDGFNRRIPLSLHVVGRIALGEAGFMAPPATFLVVQDGQPVTLWSEKGEGTLDAEGDGRVFMVRAPAFTRACHLPPLVRLVGRSSVLRLAAGPRARQRAPFVPPRAWR